MSGENERRAKAIVDRAYNGYRVNVTMWDVMASMLARALDEAEARAAVKWRPVSEPPPAHGYHLVALARRTYPGCAATSGFWDGEMWSTEPDGHSLEVTHWMPLPAPPTPTTEKEER